MTHSERLLLLIDLWVGMRLRTRLILAAICGTWALFAFAHTDVNWISLTTLVAAILAPLAFGAWRN